MIDFSVDISGRTYLMDSGTPLAQVGPLQGDGRIDDMQISNTAAEMIFVDGPIGDHRYLSNLQLRAFQLNAAPCRPLVFALNPE